MLELFTSWRMAWRGVFPSGCVANLLDLLLVFVLLVVLVWLSWLSCASNHTLYRRFGLAFGENGNGFVSYSQFALSNTDVSSSRNFFFQWAVSAAASTIVSGAIAERATVYAYLLFSFLITGFLYPVLAHAVCFLSD